jgi:hypothetical protein
MPNVRSALHKIWLKRQGKRFVSERNVQPKDVCRAFRNLVALRRRQVEPHVCQNIVLRRALTFGVQEPKIELSYGRALVGGEAIFAASA